MRTDSQVCLGGFLFEEEVDWESISDHLQVFFLKFPIMGPYDLLFQADLAQYNKLVKVNLTNPTPL